MNVTVNSQPIDIFRGATAGDAALAYSKRSFRLIGSGHLALFDRYGNPTDPGGALHEGSILFIRKTKKNG